MTLTKDDIKQIRTVVREEVGGLEKRTEDKFGNLEKGVGKKIDDAVDTLAAITKRGFDENTKQHTQIRKDISNLEFIATEMVRRDEFLELKARLVKLEAKAAK